MAYIFSRALFIRTLLLSACLTKITGFFARPGYHLQGGEIIASYAPVSWKQCVDNCLARSKCLSVEMEFRFRLCRMFSNNTLSDGVMLKRSPGVWYSEKRDWDKETLDAQCLDVCSHSETCFINGTANCVITECGKPPILDGTGLILGTELSVGSKVLYICPDDVNVTAMSVCGIDGQWSLQEFTCPVFECQDGWVLFQESCYLFPDVQTYFNDAQQYCNEKGARLVHVETEEENTFLRGQLNTLPFRDYWMGLKYSTNEQRWKWSETDAEVMFFDWYPGEPNSDTENCVVFGDTISYRWADVRCLSTRNVLCELVK